MPGDDDIAKRCRFNSGMMNTMENYHIICKSNTRMATTRYKSEPERQMHIAMYCQTDMCNECDNHKILSGNKKIR